jgi:D-sedoheptulose 7-phosphate isomerase
MTQSLYQETISSYLAAARNIQSRLNINEIEKLAIALKNTREANRTVYILGNGGSASTASHFATDLGVGTLKVCKPVRAVSLTDNMAVITAISNDKSYESVFQQQLELLGREGDLLILISASGNSKNLISALHSSRKIGMSVFSMTGFDGGLLREMTSDANVHVPSQLGEYGLVEDAHLAICHIVTECIRNK